MKRTRVIVATVAALLVVGACSTTTDPGDPETVDQEADQDTAEQPDSAAAVAEEDDTDEPPAGGLDEARITAVVEELGYECEPTDRHLKKISMAIECRGDDYMFLTASQFFDVAEMHDHFENRAIPALCDQSEMTEVRWATADDWVLVPGGEGEKDFAAHEAASEELGFDVNSHVCE